MFNNDTVTVTDFERRKKCYKYYLT